MLVDLFLKEYLLISKLHILGLFRKPPRNWSYGKKGDVVIIQGFHESFLFLQFIANEFNKIGYKIHIVEDVDSVGRIFGEAKKIERYIVKNNLREVIVLCHSKGGLIAKALVDDGAEMSARINKIVSISAPWHGTIFGYLHFQNLNELKPNSSTVEHILASKVNLHKIVNIYGLVDNHVIPNKYLILEGAKNIQTKVVGHTRILEDRGIVEIIKNECIISPWKSPL